MFSKETCYLLLKFKSLLEGTIFKRLENLFLVYFNVIDHWKSPPFKNTLGNNGGKIPLVEARWEKARIGHWLIPLAVFETRKDLFSFFSISISSNGMCSSSCMTLVWVKVHLDNDCCEQQHRCLETFQRYLQCLMLTWSVISFF